MMRSATLDVLAKIGIVPVVRADKEQDAVDAAGALLEGGIPACEITMTVPHAIGVIKRVSEAFSGWMTIGAGTVTDLEMCQKAIEAGSQFIVTPTLSPGVISLCKKENLCVIGGALTPTEILSVWEAGASAVKVFPAKAVGGPDYIRMIHEPFPEISLVPTGGVDLATLPRYLKAGAIFAGAGGDLVNKEAFQKGSINLITERARQYVSVIREARTKRENL
ncbi:MAG: bifunctional 4-hydroxy-2-oxoglutarate aldolase/2-dehydro-3-deoxy-phosphogluconate aldolase [Desulfobacteraceae bacterium]